MRRGWSSGSAKAGSRARDPVRAQRQGRAEKRQPCHETGGHTAPDHTYAVVLLVLVVELSAEAWAFSLDEPGAFPLPESAEPEADAEAEAEVSTTGEGLQIHAPAAR